MSSWRKDRLDTNALNTRVNTLFSETESAQRQGKSMSKDIIHRNKSESALLDPVKSMKYAGLVVLYV